MDRLEEVFIELWNDLEEDDLTKYLDGILHSDCKEVYEDLMEKRDPKRIVESIQT